MKLTQLVLLAVMSMKTAQGLGRTAPGEVLMGRAKGLYDGMANVDRNMQNWWDEFTDHWRSYNERTQANPDLYCSDQESLLAELQILTEKIELVKTGLDAKKEQLQQIREILEHTEYGGKSGLHCQETPEEPICEALDGLDQQAEQEEQKLAGEKQEVIDEIWKVENYSCDCQYEDWSDSWGPCSVTCEEGVKQETRVAKWQKRNQGKECAPEDAIRVSPCNEGCCPVDCKFGPWDPWTQCPEVCHTEEPQYQHRFREVATLQQCAERGGKPCEGPLTEKMECSILEIKNAKIHDLMANVTSLSALVTQLKGKLCNPNPCLNGGACEEGECSCESGFSGPRCGDKSVDIVNGGCYEDRWNRMLTGKSDLNLRSNSPKACNTFCQGYQFYAVEYAKNCFCGNELQYAVKKPEGECNMKCRGDSSKQCGGFWRLNLYKTR